MEISRLPMTVGQEVEQFESHVPADILQDYDDDYYGQWMWDGSGPRELPSIGVAKNVQSIAKKFNNTMLKYGDTPWEWRAARNGNGAGSHIHMRCDTLTSREETAEAWSIAWNTTVDLVPIFAPFWFHNWESGPRDGSIGAASRWATPETRRYTPDSMMEEISANRPRSYRAVTFNPSRGRKPLTIELRVVDAHPSIALVGFKTLRRVIKRCLERGWSVKLDQNRGATVGEMYDNLYRAGSLIDHMKEPISIVFDRGIPGIDQKEFDSMWDLLMAVMSEFLPWKGRFDRRVFDLVRSGNAQFGPQRNPRAVWHVFDDDFSWDNGPEVD